MSRKRGASSVESTDVACDNGTGPSAAKAPPASISIAKAVSPVETTPNGLEAFGPADTVQAIADRQTVLARKENFILSDQNCCGVVVTLGVLMNVER
mmetsp:Transcript_285/g.465  ORF Transcript_285/g.465 Transcript_285/m.465 type:complete len:97 (+) Transcript_285:2888-3178(+)